MTPEEAKTKWCPFARIAVSDENGRNPAPVSFNRIGVVDTAIFEIPVASLCVADKCMAWRWVNSVGKESSTDDPKRGDWLKDGHCGLAGKPS